MRVIYYDNSTVTTGELQTSRGRKEAIASFTSSQTRRLQEITGEIIVEGIFTGGILAVHRHAFEAIDSAHCDVDNIQKQRVIVRLAAVYLYSKYTCCHEKQRYKQQEEQSWCQLSDSLERNNRRMRRMVVW